MLTVFKKVMYWLNYLDRNAIALARLDDLEEDLNISDTQYQTCVSILFVGYSTCFVPSVGYAADGEHSHRSGAIEYAPHPSPPFLVHGGLHGSLGSR